MTILDFPDLKQFDLCPVTEKLPLHMHKCKYNSGHDGKHKCTYCGMTFGKAKS